MAKNDTKKNKRGINESKNNIKNDKNSKNKEHNPLDEVLEELEKYEEGCKLKDEKCLVCYK